MIKICPALGRTVKTCERMYLTLDRICKDFSTSTQFARRYVRGYDIDKVVLSFKSRQKIKAPDPFSVPQLSPQSIAKILNLNEKRFEVREGAVKSFDVNRIPSNHPIEDTDGQVKLNLWPNSHQFLFGVFDGHGGTACSRAINDRLFEYIAILLASDTILEKLTTNQITLEDLIHRYRENDIPDYLKHLYQQATTKLTKESLAAFEESSIEQHLRDAFVRLDQDLMHEGVPSNVNKDLSIDSLEAALAGSCACVGFLDDTDLYIANAGDCRAVLGVHLQDSEYKAVELSQVHSASNQSEVRRILSAHQNESSHVIRHGRLFGELAPLRAFGNCRYKWSVNELNYLIRYASSPYAQILLNCDKIIPKNYKTPPYLTAEPEIICHNLTPKDKFLVLASDGLFDMLSPDKVVKLVAGHMDGKQILINPEIDLNNMTVKEMNNYLISRKTKLANKSVDDNAATHLIRNALGPEHSRISAFLSLPEHVARDYRDDITVNVIFFDSDYICNKNVIDFDF